MFRTARLHRHHWMLGAGLLAFFLAGARTVPAQSNAWPSCDLRTTERVVAVGDVHGAYERFIDILRAAEVIDDRERWSGGRTILVQLGDVLDRGPDSRKALDLLRRLEREATRAGGHVYPLLGNHELMRMIRDWRYVSTEELAAFQTSDSADVRERGYAASSADASRRAREEQRPFDEAEYRERFMREIPLGYIEMWQAFEANGEYGAWLRELPTVIKINGIVFVHGGISADTAALGCEGINDAVRRDIRIENPTAEQRLAMSDPGGPLWYRGLAREPEAEFAPQVTDILNSLDASAIVIGHTPAPSLRIETRFEGRVIQIDTGMLDGSAFPGGIGSALEIQGDAMTAIYEDVRERLPDPVPE